mgnify:CR=1 FL=1
MVNKSLRVRRELGLGNILEFDLQSGKRATDIPIKLIFLRIKIILTCVAHRHIDR